jgi:hypothetical protein
MFTCRRSKQVWRRLVLEENVDYALSLDQSGSVVFEELLQSPINKSPILGQLGLQKTISVAAWYIWWQCREMVKGENVAPLERSAFSIQALTVNYGAAETTKAPKAEVCYKPPPNHYKMNIDACFFPNGFGAIASILHNSRGEAVAGRACPKINLNDATTTEAEAIRQDLSLVEGLGVTLVIIESDNLELINACNGVAELWDPYTAIMMECFQISQRIGSISFQFCPRKTNKVAHNLARTSFHSNGIISWDGDPPPSVMQDVLKDTSWFEI